MEQFIMGLPLWFKMGVMLVGMLWLVEIIRDVYQQYEEELDKEQEEK